ncbi:MAG: ATP-dependent RNA helicase HrpA [Salinisphaeraceae bacterium]|nr:ATP-dependent RNA helicase HrpA [Salinisphaeraceae bacterium]
MTRADEHSQGPPDPLADVQTRDRHRLSRQLAGQPGGHRSKRGKAVDADTLAQRIAQSAAITRERLAARPAIDLVPGLPISERGESLRAAVAQRQVVVICGETGSGKTTQLPKILMQAGLGARGLIGHTQPRRLAARSVAQRIAEEVGQPLGQLIGFKTRFDEQISADSQVKLMTDGILLAETRRDPFLSRYEAIIIDEAHERSLNIDFLLGYLKRLLPRRPDLKIVVTSATIDPERFARFFGDAPVINVEGRGYPVEMRYRPPEEMRQISGDINEAIEQAAVELWREGPGDILVFLPGERDIRDAERHLSRALTSGKHSQAEILPLYARLTRRAQNRIFAGRTGQRIVLATNVAETSITVPGIRYVVDTGLARISRYSTTSKVQRLPIEPVSQASCNQRAGRCGRVAPGICIRLFSEDDFDNRDAFTDPEIRRTNLASVLLTMADLKLGDIEAFPFIDPPENRFIRDGRNLLVQLQAMKATGGQGGDRITGLGRKLARLPLDPRIGRILLAGSEQAVPDALRVLAAGMTIQDPRERPAEAREQADQAQQPFTDKRSDFVSLLKLWDGFGRAKREHSGSQLRKWCRTRFINFMRMREWEDLVRQLRQIGREIEPAASSDRPASRTPLAETDYARLHLALLTGLLDHVGQQQEKGDYLGARGRQFRIFPGSGLVNKPPRWLVAGELIETSRLFAHKVARVEPEWIEKAGQHLLQREHYAPVWSARRGHVSARLRIKLFGLTLSDNKRVNFGRIDPAAAREIFIREGLVPFQIMDNRGRLPAFLAANQRLMEQIMAREARFRRRDLLVDEVTLFNFYDARLPANICDRRQLEAWLAEADGETLCFDEQTLLRHAGLELPEQDYPQRMTLGDLPVQLDYQYEPGRDSDGVTARVPLPAINQITPEELEWLVPGLLEEKLREYLKALPKALRKSVVPVPDFARSAAQRMAFGQGRLEDQLRRAVREMTGTELPERVWEDFMPSRHLQLRIAVVDEQGEVVATGRNLERLRARLGDAARAAVQARASDDVEQQGLKRWPEPDPPEYVAFEHGGVTVRATPALVDRGDQVDLKLFDDPAAAAVHHRQGVVRLLRLKARKTAKFLGRELDGYRDLAKLRLGDPPDTALADAAMLHSVNIDPANRLLADLIQAVITARVGEPPRSKAGFDSLAAEVQAAVVGDAVAAWDHIQPALACFQRIERRLAKSMDLQWMHSVEDIRDQLAHLVFTGCLSHLPAPDHLPRYLAAVEQRLEKLAQEDAGRDQARMAQVLPFWQAYKQRAVKAAKRGERPAELLEFRWMVEEYRVSVFAQPLGTAVKVSEKRLAAARDALI